MPSVAVALAAYTSCWAALVAMTSPRRRTF
jgi:hypothetical protein